MAYFAMPYRVLFHDTMAQGSHHFLTNFKFQCEAREHFYFGLANEPTPAGKALLDTLDLVTLDAYSRNLAPVTVGETVGILMSVEDQTPSAFKLCFRVVRRDGKPVACGFQSVLCTVRQTGQVMVSPEAMYAFAALKERSRRPSFCDRALAGGTVMKELFDEESIRIATSVAGGYEPALVPDILLPPTDHVRQRGEPSGIVFLFPGQGSWEPAFLRSLQSKYSPARSALQRMDRVARSLLGDGFLAACDDEAEAARLLAEHPDVAQVGIFAAGVIAARYLIDQGVKPALLVGHSFGEVTSLAAAGALDDETGAELVCHRVRALQGLTHLSGGMHAVFADETRTRAILDRLAPSSLQIAVINHAGQTVVSGSTADLQRLSTAIADAKITGAPLKSRYPFHSSLLQDAVGPFGAAIAPIAARPLHTAVYSSVDRGLYARVPDLTALPHHFVQPAIFDDAVESAYAFGGRVFVECSGSKVLSGIVKEILRGRPGVVTTNTFAEDVAGLAGARPLNDLREVPPPAPTPKASPAGPVAMAVPPAEGLEPIAIVATGCVLPGAGDPAALWQRLLARQGGIVDLGERDHTLAEDFKADRRMTPDKTYSLLCGHVNAEARHADEALTTQLATLPTVGRFFAQAASQCVAAIRAPLPPPDRICCVVGSTADGSREMDEALMLAGVEARMRAMNAPPEVIDLLSSTLGRDTGRTLEDAAELSGPRAFARVAQALFGQPVSVLAVDAACASSLYAIDIGVQALRDRRCDLALCGGAFAPGPASTCLFAQFQGLSAAGSRPLDAGADGVVFGEGSALVVLKRLSEAIAAGDPIHAVIRAVASSSDGKSASVMEPKPGGQLLAIRRAAERAQITPSTLQFIDAHATATPVGDAVEFTSLREAVGPVSDNRPRVRVGSLKAAIGHTGWVAGAASLVEVCQAIGARMFPPQLNFTTPNPKFDLPSANITIQADSSPWPENTDGLPRRAGINGFGFGGCNAHVVLEAFDPRYHSAIAPSPQASADMDIAIVGISSFFPANATVAGAGWRFAADELRLPPKVRILPDIADQMDAGHVLAIACAQAIADALPSSWNTIRPETGVVIGFDGKTRRGIDALLPIYRDRLARRFKEMRDEHAIIPDLDRIAETTLDAIDRLPRSGPYTLGGAMPNVTAGRVANTLNLNGPNLVIDAEGFSLYQALVHAERQLRSGACRFMLAGGIGCSAGPDVERVVRSRDRLDSRSLGEAAIMLALTSSAVATELGLPVLGYLTAADRNGTHSEKTFAVGRHAAFLMGAEGARELADAVAALHDGGTAIVRWSGREGSSGLALTLRGPAARPAAAPQEEPTADVSDSPLHIPLQWTAPGWVAAPTPNAPHTSTLTGRRVLVLTDQPAACLSPSARAALGRFEYRVVCPSDRGIPGGLSLDLDSDAHAMRSIQQLDAWPYDALVVLANVEAVDPVDGVTASKHVSGGLIDLMFVVTRHAYARLATGEVAIGAICLNAVASIEHVHPLTGLLSGFLRSLTHELPAARCCQVNTSDADLAGALDRLDEELSRADASRVCEVCFENGGRFIPQLTELAAVSAGAPLLTRESVVVATGGARGVTAVLVDAIRREFGCTTVLLGRTPLGRAPENVLAMDDQAFEQFEAEFYQRELAARPGTRPADLKATYQHYRAVREAAETLRALGELPGALEYIRTDVTNPAEVDAAIQQIVERFGRIDLIVHGAGIQISKALRKKRLEDFRGIVATKLGGLGHLIQSCRTHLRERLPHWHLVTSTFSHAGNDGQEDYGAANLGMDRLAAYMRGVSDGLDISTLGWIAWINVGMTRGSEYASLAVQRRLGGVTRERGRARFRDFISGRPSSPVTYLISNFETAYFGITIAPPALTAATAVEKPQQLEQTLEVDCDVYPFLRDHTVNGVPTLPAAFGLELAARVAATLRPGLDIERFLDIKVERFVKIPDGRSFTLRGTAEVLEESADRCRLLVRLLSDFAHASGRVLQRDILHMSTEVVLGPTTEPIAGHEPVTTIQSGWRLSDPYLHVDSPVHLDGPFRSVADIQLTPSHTTAVFHGGGHDFATRSGLFVPFVLLDGLWRMAAMRREDSGMAPVYVPLGATEVVLLKGIDDATLSGGCTLASSVPRVDGDRVHVEWAQAADQSGRILLTVANLLGAEYGRVRAEVEALRSPRTDAAHDGRPSAVVAIASKPSNRAMSRALDGKVAFVTGSGRGLGKVVATKLAERGAFVIVNSFHSPDQGEQTAAEIVASGGQALHLWGSVAQPAHLAKMFSQIDAVAGGLDLLVSNASSGVFAKIDAFTPEQWNRSFRTNVVALHQSAVMAAERMQRRGGGSIVALSSIGARWCFERFGLVGPIKAAVEALVKYLAVELAPANVVVNALSAGAIDGEVLRSHPGRPRWENLAPNRRLMTEDEVADAVVFLLTARGFNGGTLVIDGASGLRTLEPQLAISQGGQI